MFFLKVIFSILICLPMAYLAFVLVLKMMKSAGIDKKRKGGRES